MWQSNCSLLFFLLSWVDKGKKDDGYTSDPSVQLSQFCIFWLSDDLDILLAELRMSLGIRTPEKAGKSWTERQEALDVSWEQARQEIFQIMLEKEAVPEAENCQLCQRLPASVQCHDCKQFLCKECDVSQHKLHILHSRDHWADGFFILQQ